MNCSRLLVQKNPCENHEILVHIHCNSKRIIATPNVGGDIANRNLAPLALAMWNGTSVWAWLSNVTSWLFLWDEWLWPNGDKPFRGSGRKARPSKSLSPDSLQQLLHSAAIPMRTWPSSRSYPSAPASPNEPGTGCAPSLAWPHRGSWEALM